MRACTVGPNGTNPKAHWAHMSGGRPSRPLDLPDHDREVGDLNLGPAPLTLTLCLHKPCATRCSMNQYYSRSNDALVLACSMMDLLHVLLVLSSLLYDMIPLYAYLFTINIVSF